MLNEINAENTKKNCGPIVPGMRRRLKRLVNASSLACFLNILKYAKTAHYQVILQLNI